MLHLPQELRDGELFRDLPDLTRPVGSEGRGLNWDGSFADAYIKRLQALRADGLDGGDAGQQRRECFLALEQYVLDYLELCKPIRRFPSSAQAFGGGGDLDYFYEMNGGEHASGSAGNGAVLAQYRRELEQRGKVLKWYGPYLRRRSPLWRTLLRFLPGAACFAAAGWVFYACPLEPLFSLLILLLALLGVFFLGRWSAALSYRAVFLHYRKFLEKDGRLLEYYRYARFCQLWCSMEGKRTPEVVDSALAEINRAIDRYRRITQFYPDLG